MISAHQQPIRSQRAGSDAERRTGRYGERVRFTSFGGDPMPAVEGGGFGRRSRPLIRGVSSLFELAGGFAAAGLFSGGRIQSFGASPSAGGSEPRPFAVVTLPRAAGRFRVMRGRPVGGGFGLIGWRRSGRNDGPERSLGGGAQGAKSGSSGDLSLVSHADQHARNDERRASKALL